MMRLRQIAFVAQDLAKVVDDLCGVLGVEVCFRDPGVAEFGLHNALMPLGDRFLEVVSPVREGTTAGRLLERRRGDGGYMVIVQVDDLAAQRKRVEELGVRIVWKAELAPAATIHLHPRDVGAAILSFDWMREPDGWLWAGPEWREHVRTDLTRRMVGAELQGPDPRALAERWGQVFGRPVRPRAEGGYELALDGGTYLRFVADHDGRGEGVSGLDVEVSDPLEVVHRARARGVPATHDEVEICGVRIRLLRPS
ncbi:MAG TPA: VOC family protein [Myxococcota bacterium]|nr:VOC family protein [Myxococcota bacterium]